MKQWIVAHRGASFDAPENTLAAFRLAWEQGADAIEGDFQPTADGHLVCFHDFTLRRTAGVEGRLPQLTLAQAKQLDVGRWKGEAFAGERVPTLDEVLAIVPAGKHLFLEIKGGPRAAEPMQRALRGSPEARAKVRVISFEADLVRAAKAVPGVTAFWLVEFKDELRRHWLGKDEVCAMLDAIGADGLDIEARPELVDAAFAQAIADAGRELHTWTIDDAALAKQMLERGVRSITTNRPRSLRDALMMA